jgi:ketosteroid isomerase-like protein
VVLGITADPGAPRDHRGATAAGLADRPQGAEYATAEIEELIAKYAAAVNREPVDIDLASSVWSNTPEASLIYPLGEERGWEQVKRNFYEHTMEARFSERTLTPHDIRVHAYGDSGWAEFSWSFVGKSRKDGVQSGDERSGDADLPEGWLAPVGACPRALFRHAPT